MKTRYQIRFRSAVAFLISRMLNDTVSRCASDRIVATLETNRFPPSDSSGPLCIALSRISDICVNCVKQFSKSLMVSGGYLLMRNNCFSILITSETRAGPFTAIAASLGIFEIT